MTLKNIDLCIRIIYKYGCMVTVNYINGSMWVIMCLAQRDLKILIFSEFWMSNGRSFHDRAPLY